MHAEYYHKQEIFHGGLGEQLCIFMISVAIVKSCVNYHVSVTTLYKVSVQHCETYLPIIISEYVYVQYTKIFITEHFPFTVLHAYNV